MSTQKNNGEESKEPDYDEDNDQDEERQEEKARGLDDEEKKTTNQVF